ncbi:MAG: potassium-transporting ATPase subunit C [Acidimicrobiales bacterium]
MLVTIRRAAVLSLLLIVLCLVYTFVETGIGQVLFTHQADGSMTAYGSTEIGQAWTGPQWFQGRDETPDPALSGPTNLGPRSEILVQQVKERVEQLVKEGIRPTNDLVTGSGSGLDPDITPADAYAQVNAVAKANHLPVAEVRNLVAENAAGAYFGFFGSPYVNVLELNEALAKLK